LNASGLVPTRPLSPSPVPARHELKVLLESTRWPGDVDAVVLAVHEALINSQRHAGGATSAWVGLDGRRVVVEVCDSGPGFDLESHASHPPDAMAERGRGLWIISQIARRCDVRQRHGQTCLVLQFQP
jgi:anti-sigma regulatory factor (Ser/Thr protein kinase)